jgi:hypothetical protein
MSFSKAAVIVETRPLPELSKIIQQHLDQLDESWKLYIFHSSQNETILQADFPQATRFNLNPTNNVFTLSDYNALMTSEYFWNLIAEEKILIFQSDSMLLRKGIDEFLQWDYIGAPWLFQQHGGNGGLSLRSKSKMIEILKTWDYTKRKYGNEDVFYSNKLQIVNGKLAPRSECFKFSCEVIFQLGTLGYHAIDKWLTNEQIDQIKNQYKNG